MSDIYTWEREQEMLADARDMLAEQKRHGEDALYCEYCQKPIDNDDAEDYADGQGEPVHYACWQQKNGVSDLSDSIAEAKETANDALQNYDWQRKFGGAGKAPEKPEVAEMLYRSRTIAELAHGMPTIHTAIRMLLVLLEREKHENTSGLHAHPSKAQYQIRQALGALAQID